MNLPMEPVSALPAESPALQRCAMRQIVEAYFGITPSSGYRSMCQRPGYPGDRPCTNINPSCDLLTSMGFLLQAKG